MAVPTPEPTIKDIDALLSGATPQFALQLKPRVWAMIADLPEGSDVRAYGLAQMQLLDEIALGTTRAPRGTRSRPDDDALGWERIPSHPAGSPH